MKEIRANILECYDRYQLLILPISLYQKKFTGEIVVDPNSFVQKLVEKWPKIPSACGSAIESFGSCPAIAYSIPNTKYPTKILTFPISPSSIRLSAENVEKMIVGRLAKTKQFKKSYNTLVPGWMLRVRTDHLEFSCRKTVEVISYYKLTEVAFITDALGLDSADAEYYEKVVKEMFLKFFRNLPITLVYAPKQEPSKEVVPEVVQSVVKSSYVEDTTESD